MWNDFSKYEFKLKEARMTREWKPLDRNILSLIRYTIDSMAPTCGSMSKSVGDIINLGAIPRGGTAPYKVEFYKGSTTSTPIKTFNNVTEVQSVTTTYTTLSNDSGSIDFITKVTDSCSQGPKTNEERCTVTITTTGCTVPTVNMTLN